MFENIKLEYDGSIALLTINRPEKRNAVTNATVEEIDKALSEIEKRVETRVLILTGAGDKAFSISSLDDCANAPVVTSIMPRASRANRFI